MRFAANGYFDSCTASDHHHAFPLLMLLQLVGLCCGLVLILAIFVVTIDKSMKMNHDPITPSAAAAASAASSSNHVVSFVVLEQPDWRVLTKLLVNHEREQHHLLEQLGQSLEVARQTEADYQLPTSSYSIRLQARIHRLVELLEHDLDVLRSTILVPFATTLVLPAAEADSNGNECRSHGIGSKDAPESATTHSTRQLGYYSPSFSCTSNISSSSSYNSVSQVVAHLVRDWTDHGQAIRDSLYAWCIEQVGLINGNEQQQQNASPLSILVPGAGLGRLAYDLARQGHVVHAIEVSQVMTAAAAFVLKSPSQRSQQQQSNIYYNDAGEETIENFEKDDGGDENANRQQQQQQLQIHPYLMDALTNEVDSQLRYTPVTISTPADLSSQQLPPGASLSYTVSDFLHLPLAASPHYSVVVTCFFIDTATNILDYLRKIHDALVVGGTWINVGPLQWHRNALLFPSADELKELVQDFGFVVTSWNVDSDPMEYRNRHNSDEGDMVRSTHYDAYCPIRFVVIKRE